MVSDGINEENWMETKMKKVRDKCRWIEWGRTWLVLVGYWRKIIHIDGEILGRGNNLRSVKGDLKGFFRERCKGHWVKGVILVFGGYW